MNFKNLELFMWLCFGLFGVWSLGISGHFYLGLLHFFLSLIRGFWIYDICEVEHGFLEWAAVILWQVICDRDRLHAFSAPLFLLEQSFHIFEHILHFIYSMYIHYYSWYHLQSISATQAKRFTKFRERKGLIDKDVV